MLVGLGNPGARYVGTRHNFGFEAVDHVARFAGASWGSSSSETLLARGHLEGQDVVLAKPLTFMNRSGLAVRDLVESMSIPAAQLLVLFDDVALPLGRLRIRERGGSGGHLGLASILSELANDAVPRIRLGIRPADTPGDLASFVLQPFDVHERATVKTVLDRTLSATRIVLREGLPKAMSIYNRPEPPEGEGDPPEAGEIQGVPIAPIADDIENC